MCLVINGCSCKGTSYKLAPAYGLSIISIILSANGRKAKKKAIEIYNHAQNKNKSLSYGEKPKIYLSSKGLLVHF